jgi:hypothetical protein
MPIFNVALFPPLGAILVHYNLSPLNTISCVSTMKHHNYDPIRHETGSVETESSLTLEGDIFPDVFLLSSLKGKIQRGVGYSVFVERRRR